MIVNYSIVILLSYIFQSACSIPTTTRIYDLDVLGADPIRIVEGENLWGNKEETTPKPTSRFQRRSFTTASSTNLHNPINQEQESNSEEFSHSALRDFLNSYAEKVTKDKSPDRTVVDEDKEGKKNWNVLNLREHNNPYDDKKGWVSLEPVPWSLSKISKWQSKPSTTERPWGGAFPSPEESKPPLDLEYTIDRVSSWNNRRPIQDNTYKYENRPENNNYNRPEMTNKNKFQVYYMEDDKPLYPKPSATYGQSVHLHPYPGFQRDPVKTHSQFNQHHNCNHEEDVGIITDGRPSDFPSYYENRRIGTELHPETHPHMGEGEWVLLSTTKGYKSPKSRQRSLDINTHSIGTRQSIKLTVLPPLKESKVNMTISHGGLLQVDSAPETVEQAQKKFIKLQKMKEKPKRPAKPVKKRKPVRELTSSTIATIPRHTPPDSSAVLAAVGAGMIPATMAMLVPMAMNGKKRRKRNVVFATRNPNSNVQITLPRYL